MWIEWKESKMGTKFVALVLRQGKVNVTLYQRGLKYSYNNTQSQR